MRHIETKPGEGAGNALPLMEFESFYVLGLPNIVDIVAMAARAHVAVISLKDGAVA